MWHIILFWWHLEMEQKLGWIYSLNRSRDFESRLSGNTVWPVTLLDLLFIVSSTHWHVPITLSAMLVTKNCGREMITSIVIVSAIHISGLENHLISFYFLWDFIIFFQNMNCLHELIEVVFGCIYNTYIYNTHVCNKILRIIKINIHGK